MTTRASTLVIPRSSTLFLIHYLQQKLQRRRVPKLVQCRQDQKVNSCTPQYQKIKMPVMETSVSQQTSHKQRTTVRTLITCCSYCFHLFTWTIHGPRSPPVVVLHTITVLFSIWHAIIQSQSGGQRDETSEATLRRLGNIAHWTRRCYLAMTSRCQSVGTSHKIHCQAQKSGTTVPVLAKRTPGRLKPNGSTYILILNRFICERYKLIGNSSIWTFLLTNPKDSQLCFRRKVNLMIRL